MALFVLPMVKTCRSLRYESRKITTLVHHCPRVIPVSQLCGREGESVALARIACLQPAPQPFHALL